MFFKTHILQHCMYTNAFWLRGLEIWKEPMLVVSCKLHIAPFNNNECPHEVCSTTSNPSRIKHQISQLLLDDQLKHPAAVSWCLFNGILARTHFLQLKPEISRWHRRLSTQWFGCGGWITRSDAILDHPHHRRWRRYISLINWSQTNAPIRTTHRLTSNAELHIPCLSELIDFNAGVRRDFYGRRFEIPDTFRIRSRLSDIFSKGYWQQIVT